MPGRPREIGSRKLLEAKLHLLAPVEDKIS